MLNSDDEDEEDIESENENDRAFLDDESGSESQDAGFYRALDQERGEGVEVQRGVEEEQEKKKEHPLVKLKVCILHIYSINLSVIVNFSLGAVCDMFTYANYIYIYLFL